MFLAFAGEELGEDGGGKCRIVELDRQTGALVLRLLFPGGADFGLADEDAVAGGVAARIVFRNDANQFRLHRESDDLSPILAGNLLERADPGHDACPFLGPGRPTARRSVGWGIRVSDRAAPG